LESLFYIQCIFVSTETPLARGEGTWIFKFSTTYRRKQSPVGVNVVTSFIFDKLVFIYKRGYKKIKNKKWKKNEMKPHQKKIKICISEPI